ncbi:MAG: hypothetical protein EA403_04350, partial [Spirochaetaceae bacterium]
LDGEEYAISVERVEEVIEYEVPTPVPRSPAYLLGIINVRGRLVPILDLRRRFGLLPAEATVNSRFVVLDLHWAKESLSLGVLTDSVQGVIDIPQDAMGPPPKIGRAGAEAFLKGTARVQDRILMVMEVDQILTPALVHEGFAELSSQGR